MIRPGKSLCVNIFLSLVSHTQATAGGGTSASNPAIFPQGCHGGWDGFCRIFPSLSIIRRGHTLRGRFSGSFIPMRGPLRSPMRQFPASFSRPKCCWYAKASDSIIRDCQTRCCRKTYFFGHTAFKAGIPTLRPGVCKRKLLRYRRLSVSFLSQHWSIS